MSRVTEENYKAQLKDSILPILFNKINSLSSSTSVMSSIVDLARAYCYESNLSDEDNVPIFDTLSSENINFEDKDVNAISLFVLASTLYLTLTESIKADEIILDNNANLGFQDCIDYLHNSIEYADSQDLKGYTDLCVSDLKALVQQRLKLTIGTCTVEEYFRNKIYLNDLNVVLNSLSPVEDEVNKVIADVLKYCNTQINITVKKIMRTYTSLFSSAYQVVKPKGLLTSKGIAYLNGSELCFDDSHEAFQIYSYLVSQLGFTEVPSRDFNLNLIVSNFLNNPSNPSRFYFPMKLLEFAYGCSSFNNNTDGEGVQEYPKASNIKSWGDYSSSIVEPLIRTSCQNTVVLLFGKKGYLQEEGYKTSEAFETLKSILEHLYKNLTPCMIVSNWKEVADDITDKNSATSIVGFKIRVSDTEHSLPLTQDISRTIVESVFGGLVGDKDAVYEAVTPVGERDYSVCDIQHKFSPAIVNGEPLFAYTALDALKASGKSPSWENLILGKRDDDSILTIGDGDISFRNNLAHWIMAGSRSGKGVMTLNILANAIASGKPVFYIDNKPDMASMFRSSKLSGGKMFCVNADYNASFDVMFQSCSPEQFNWDAHIPDYVKKKIGNNYSNYAPIFYMRAVMLLMSLIYVRGNVSTMPDKYNLLGGKDGIVVVIDEITAADAGINAILDKTGILGSSFYSSATLSDAELKNNKNKQGQPIVDEFGCYSTDLIRSLNETFRTICGQWKLKGLVGGGSEGDISDVFIIGQELHEVDTSKKEYIPTNDNNMNRMSGDAFYNFLFDLGCDGFFGYNMKKPEYMWSSLDAAYEGSKASTRLNATARNFAFIKELNQGTVSTMLDSRNDGKSSKEIADNAVYFKPFLILNDADENSSYVAQDFKKFCRDANLDFDVVKSMHKDANGVLQPKIGFIPYINAQCDNLGSIGDILIKSYDIANNLVHMAGYPKELSCIDYIYDLRPEYMFTAQSLLNAVTGAVNDKVAKLSSQFFGGGISEESGSGYDDVDGTDFNNTSSLDSFNSTFSTPMPSMGGAPVEPVISGSVPIIQGGAFDNQTSRRDQLRQQRGMESMLENAMGSVLNARTVEEQFRTIMDILFIKHPDWGSFITEDEREMIISMCVSAYNMEGGSN